MNGAVNLYNLWGSASLIVLKVLKVLKSLGCLSGFLRIYGNSSENLCSLIWVQIISEVPTYGAVLYLMIAFAVIPTVTFKFMCLLHGVTQSCPGKKRKHAYGFSNALPICGAYGRDLDLMQWILSTEGICMYNNVAGRCSGMIELVQIEPIGGDNQQEQTTSEQPLSMSSQSPCSDFSKYEELAAKWIQKGYTCTIRFSWGL
ncbi:hypothetical protein POM88_041161 [Heracleum sosnowskyi]|uniref:Uncharacterized protein n=1 Tax=Heracleum sosnowskyi TaxID=360622 RepID=A0AAD8HDN1_9APIA|nr:hypothetical protein POM88_041161 [Heracleum sosnowskyi]